jgi:phosphopantothenoylcysteine decarboxylase/phosphopantothenate--cysteine ligase
MLKEKTVVLGVTGGIAAYKAAELASRLSQEGALVDVVMTQAATEFVTPLTFQSLTHRPVHIGLFDSVKGFDVEHIALAERADVVVIAPATANIIAKVACGLADDLLSCVVLATAAPIVVAPAMNVHMYENSVTQENIAKLRERGLTIVDPAQGHLACGDVGVGRLADLEDVMGAIGLVLGRRGDLAGRRIVVTAGGTQEPIDPVRHITNLSSGKMGYALAEAARDRGATVMLITAPTSLCPPAGVSVSQVQTALEMEREVLQTVPSAEVLIMAAAVADYRPAVMAESKIKKQKGDSGLTLELVENPDILAEVPEGPLKIGFAAETEDLVEGAERKLREKQLDLIVANDITDPGSTFGSDTNKVVLIDRKGNKEDLPLLSKSEVAHSILDRVVNQLHTRTPSS